MSRDANVVQVEIFGQIYNLRAEGDASDVQSLAAYVDGKMREVATQTKTVDSLRVAILAALNIADERRRAAGPGAVLPIAAAAPAKDRAAADLDRRVAEWERLLDEALAG